MRGKYALTGKLRVLGWSNSKKNNLIQALRLPMADLARKLDTDVLAARSGIWWQVVLKYTGSCRFSITTDLGNPVPDRKKSYPTGETVGKLRRSLLFSNW